MAAARQRVDKAHPAGSGYTAVISLPNSWSASSPARPEPHPEERFDLIRCNIAVVREAAGSNVRIPGGRLVNLLTDPAPTTGPATVLHPSSIAVPIAVEEGRTMAPDRLLRYLRIKVHHLIQERDRHSICVVDGCDRHAVISTFEKPGKLFDVERPTAPGPRR